MLNSLPLQHGVISFGQFAGLGIILILVSPIIFIVGIVLVCFQKTRIAGLITMLCGVVIGLIGGGICAFNL